MKRTPALAISKLDAAKRQIEVAIRLFFFDDDPVSIYTLAAAAYGVLRDIAAKKSIQLQTMEQRLVGLAIPGKERELHAALRRHQNFFKHADRDADEAIDFNPDSTEWLLFDCAIAYAQMTGETTPLMGAMSLWWQFNHRDLIKAEHVETRMKLESQAQWFKSGRRRYLAKVLPLLQHPNAA